MVNRDELVEFFLSNQKIQAIKCVRKGSDGLGLYEAKLLVDKFWPVGVQVGTMEGALNLLAEVNGDRREALLWEQYRLLNRLMEINHDLLQADRYERECGNR